MDRRFPGGLPNSIELRSVNQLAQHSYIHAATLALRANPDNPPLADDLFKLRFATRTNEHLARLYWSRRERSIRGEACAITGAARLLSVFAVISVAHSAS